MMPPEVKKYLSRNIQSQFDKDPAIQSGEVKKWLLSGNQPFDLSTIKSNTLSKFISQDGWRVAYWAGLGHPEGESDAGSPEKQSRAEESDHQILEGDWPGQGDDSEPYLLHPQATPGCHWRWRETDYEGGLLVKCI